MIIRVFLSLLLVIAIIGLRSFWFYKESPALIELSQQFPRHYFLGDPSHPHQLYVVLGDSTARGTGASRIESSYSYLLAKEQVDRGMYVEVRNIAEPGARLHDLITKQLPQLTTVHPDFITISIGANDATHFTPLASYEADLKTLTRILKGQTVFIANTPDMSLIPSLPFPIDQVINARAKAQNTLLEKFPLQVVDLYGKVKLKQQPYWAADAFHPSDQAYLLWAKQFALAGLPLT